MGVDYDLVIVGGSLVAREAALMAVRSRANVALVEPPLVGCGGGLAGLAEVTRLSGEWSRFLALGLSLPDAEANLTNQNLTIDWSKVGRWNDAIANRLNNLLSPVYLAGQGIDIVCGQGEFTTSPQLGFLVNETSLDASKLKTKSNIKPRVLTARRYLLAMGSQPWIPNLEGLKTTGFATLDNFASAMSREKPPQHWLILAGVPQGLEVAQILARLGAQVTLVMTKSTICTQTHTDAWRLLQAQLEADGVEIIFAQQVTQARLIDGKKWLQVDDKAIESDEILVAIAQKPNLEGFNLAAADVKWHSNRLLTNRFLATTNSRIYACGDVIGGYASAHLANYEAQIAVHNCLFRQTKTVNYQQVSLVINTLPSLAQIGLTFNQAENEFPQQVIDLQVSFQDLSIAQITGNLTGFCSVVAHQNGQILGACIYGETATEIINIITLAIQQKISIKHLENFAVTAPSYTQFLTIIAHKWHELKLERNFFYQEFIDDWFQFRRRSG